MKRKILSKIKLETKIKIGLLIILILSFTLIKLDNQIEMQSKINDYQTKINDLELELKLAKESKEIFKEALISQVQLSKKYKTQVRYDVLIQKDLNNRIKNKLITSGNSALIYTNVLKYAEKYNINPLIIYAIICQESSLIPDTIHNDVIVDVYGKKVKTNAIGLGGIVYEIWADKLIKNKIISSKRDLFDIDKNIEAVAYILSDFYKLKEFKGRTKTETMILRYFGGNNPTYLKSINKKILELINL